VQRVLLVILGLVAGCYQDPDYSGTRFRCDDVRGCPAGQTCIGGMCSDGSGGPDAGGADGVACGSQRCANGDQCCVDFIGAPSCLAAGVTCAGFAATCDGIEDCDGNACCREGAAIACGAACNEQICLEPADCPPGAAMCCFGITLGEPWGHCLAACP
jgi:hypothetical protein